jgi:polysaccharide pyruvyl transferase WcaK-like protein
LTGTATRNFGLPARDKAGRRAKPRMSIGIFGQFGTGNTGNDGSLEAMMVFLRKAAPGSILTCVCSGPEKVHTEHQVDAVRISSRASQVPPIRFLNLIFLGVPRALANWVYAYSVARKLDILIVPGTGILDDFQEGPMGWPYVLFRWCAVSRLSGTKIALVSVGAGPIHHRLSRWFVKSAARMAAYRSFRDAGSKAFMKSIGSAGDKDPVYPDVAFALPISPRLTIVRDSDNALVVGVGVMGYFGWKKDEKQADPIYRAYLAKIVGFIDWLLDEGFQVRILTGDTHDQVAVDDLLAVFSGSQSLTSGQLLAWPASSLHELMGQIAQTDIVVATRFHNIVCALKLGRPTVSVGYAEKNDLLMTDVGLGAYCQKIEALDIELLKDQVRQLIDNRRALETQIAARTQVYSAQLAQQFATLTDLVH